ncbi:hypothetical protein E1B28_012608 [Marasmius oreades]|uniref:PROP1-like PPR domain-containing protein n=1 Tax=Marasmius oreades TaxID=181124 RepID=A0A9P7UQ39_9AGAR|nr:uncharacterized protein E1B28_012608 [Marasmius oreades]KAG7088636.1 hypothetical protein E1B28_012608 [Marasmius oreades]
MLPKVATTLIHSTGRVAAVHTQSHHTIRNVLQLPSSSSAKGNPGSGYFNSNNSGPRGGRFTHGYHGASRAVTQANPTIAVDDGSYVQIDEQEESATPSASTPRRSSGQAQRPRIRSHSVSHSRHEHRLGVLKSVQQLQAQSRHVFDGEGVRCSSTSSAGSADQQPTEESSVEMSAGPPPPAATSHFASIEPQSSTDPSSPQSVLPLTRPNSPLPPSSPPLSVTKPNQALHFTSPSKDPEYTTQVVLSFLKSLEQTPTNPTLHDFNRALQALYDCRVAGEPLNLLLQTYNALLSQDLHPDFHTYFTMIRAFIDRHGELSRAVARMHYDAKWKSPALHQVEEKFLRIEQELQSTVPTALSLFRAMLTIPSSSDLIPDFLYKNLLRVCATHGNVQGAITVWEAVETASLRRAEKDGHSFRLATPHMYAHLITALAKGGEISGCKDSFEQFKEQFPLESLSTPQQQRHAMLVYNSMIDAYFRCGMPEMALETLEVMLGSDGFKPSISTFTTIVSGFCTGEGPVDVAVAPISSSDSSTSMTGTPPAGVSRGEKDLSTALLWFNRLLEQPHSPRSIHPLQPLENSPTRPDAMGWAVMLEALVNEAEHETSVITLDNYEQLSSQDTGANVLQTLNTLLSRWSQTAEVDNVVLPAFSKYLAARVNLDRAVRLQQLSSSVEPAQQADVKRIALSHLDIVTTIIPPGAQTPLAAPGSSTIIKGLWDVLFTLGEVDRCVHMTSELSNSYEIMGATIAAMETQLSRDPLPNHARQMEIQTLISERDRDLIRFRNIAVPFVERLFLSPSLSLHQAIAIYRVWEKLKMNYLRVMDIGLLTAYSRERKQYPEVTMIPSLSALQPTDWVALLDRATIYGLNPEGAPEQQNDVLLALLRDAKIMTSRLEWDIEWPALLKTSLVNAISYGRTPGEIRNIIQESVPEVGGLKGYLSNTFESSWESTESSVGSEQASSAPTSPMVSSQVPGFQEGDTDLPYTDIPESMYIDVKLTKSLNEYLSRRVLTTANTRPFTDQLFTTFHNHLTKQRKVPSPATLSQLVAAFGRAGELDRIYYVYRVAQNLLKTMERNKKMQSESWFIIEDGMIIALCQAGQAEKAHIHRGRMLEQGGAPSADAYGGLVLHVKDTTDDTSNAMELYQEALSHGVEPNVYLYNNIISKLAKARKADKALELFTEMKSSRYSPSPITYGAVIGACARVGDVASAETLFKEMSMQLSFKPRVPPFNTMMQLYTTTKPDREHALWYFEEMQRLGVAPTEYTYKLLMDAYALEPIDVPALQATFATLAASPHLRVQSTHYATLISAYGCVLKDLQLAQSTFSSIPPSVLDALAVEALVNVLVAHRRMDLAPGYIELMNEKGIHMTAYIVNGLIKGYSTVGDVERAREIFEGTVDPPVGMAGMHNHVGPHLNGNGEVVRPAANTAVGPLEPIYREPSTWEAMVRAELGAGHRDRAHALVERMKTRQYPEAVVNRVQGIMVDHSQLLL